MKYLERLLEQYSKTHDIVRDYEIGGIKSDAYGYYRKVSEKYVINPKANLWSIQGFEHILFFERDKVTRQDVDEVRRLMEEHMAPVLVCKGNKYPEKDHMYSYLTAAFICSAVPDEDTVNAIEKFRYEKDYLFTIRGHVEGHIILMDVTNGKAYSNKVAKHLKKFYENEYESIRKGI